MRWEKITLGEGAKFIRGITFKPAQKTDAGSLNSVVCLRTKNVQDKLDESDLIAVPVDLIKNEEKFVKIGDTLVSSANSWNLVGKCCYVSKLKHQSTAGGFISILRANEKLNQKYLYRWFSSPFTQHIVRSFGNQTTNISNLDQKRTLKLKIPLPPLPEQKRIASILDAADALRTKRRQAIAMLDELLQATFLDMFGDPVTNPKGWEVVFLANQIVHMNNGLSRRRKISENRGEIVLRLQDVQYDGINFEDINRIPLDEKEKSKFELIDGDIVFIRVNGNPDYVSRSAVFNGHTEPVFHNDHLIRIRLDSKAMNPIFLVKILNYDKQKRIIGKHIKTAAGQHTISQDGLKEVEIPLPPLTLQTQFANIVEKVEAQKAVQQAHLAELDTLFASLQQRAFAGAL